MALITPDDLDNSTPDEWSTECEEKRVKVEVFRDETSEWLEIPTADVQLDEGKEGSADITRSCKVVFPTEWYGKSVRRYITATEDGLPVQFARVLFKRYEDDRYVLKHFGYIAGVGGTTNDLESKFWINDFSTLLKGIHPTVAYKSETNEDIINDISKQVNKSLIPLVGTVIMPPDSELEYEQLAAQYANQNQVISTNTFTGNLISGGTQNIDRDILVEQPSGFELTQYLSHANEQELRTATQEDVVEFFSSTTIGGANPNSLLPELTNRGKTFQANRDNLIDVLEWFTDRSKAKWHFEPAPSGNGVLLVFDITPERRLFSDEKVIEAITLDDDEVAELQGGLRQFVEQTDANEYSFFKPLDIINNDALYEINPINTLIARGASSSSQRGTFQSIAYNPNDLIEEAAEELGLVAGDVQSKQFPYVKVQQPQLVEAANDFETIEYIEPEAKSLDEVENVAVKKFRNILNESTEGEIETYGQPHLTPYDAIDAFEQCGDYLEVLQKPIRYEVDKITHRQRGGGIYKMYITVSIYANDENIEIAESYMKSLSQ